MTDRKIDLSVEVPGTVEEVWQAIATGPGITSWFVPCTLEEREGGAVSLDFGTFGSEAATVSVWEPLRRIVYGTTGERPLAHEWTVEAVDGDTCIVRLVNTGFGDSEDWDADYDGMSEGWLIFLQNLRLHLTHHRGEHAAAAVPTTMIAGPHHAAWARLCATLGIPTDLEDGAPFAVTAEGAPALTGRVDHVLRTRAATTYLLVLDGPAPGTGFVSAEGDGDVVGVSTYVHLYGPDAARVGADLSAWFLDRLSSPAPAGS